MMEAVGVFGGPTLLIAIVLLILWDRNRHHHKNALPVADGPADEPYRIFTEAFDLVINAEDLPQGLWEASPDVWQGWSSRTEEPWQRAEALAADYRFENAAGDAINAKIRDNLSFRRTELRPENLAICFLVDQSGSMRGAPMAATAAVLECVTEILVATGVTIEILGFSTVGWQGGRARLQWIERGRAKRPGRLCALLHIIYKAAAAPVWSATSRRAMLYPDILRENVDGEALRWAANRLTAISAQQHILIILSDGAPVDDSTLLYNGSLYLWRDLKKAIREIETSTNIRLGAVGIGQYPAELYRECVSSDLSGLADSIVELIERLILRTGPPADPDTAPE